MRRFPGGATRDDGEGKPEFASCLSPIVLRRFGKFMLRHNIQADGKKRTMDNWKSGMPREVYLESLFRHFIDVWQSVAEDTSELRQDQLEDALCSMFFNVQGLLQEVLIGRDVGIEVEEPEQHIEDKPLRIDGI